MSQEWLRSLLTCVLTDRSSVLDAHKRLKKKGTQLLDATARVYQDAELFAYVEQFNKRPGEFDFNEWVEVAFERQVGAMLPLASDGEGDSA